MSTAILPESVSEVMSQLSIFGCLKTMKHVALERNGLPNLRYQISGKRQIVIATFEAIKKIAEVTGVDIGTGEDVSEWMGRALQHAKEDHLTHSEVQNGLFFHEQKAGDLLILPTGVVTAERVIPFEEANADEAKIERESIVVGVRYHWLEGKDANGFKRLHCTTEKQQAQSIADDKTGRFWQLILSQMDPVSKAPSGTTWPKAIFDSTRLPSVICPKVPINIQTGCVLVGHAPAICF